MRKRNIRKSVYFNSEEYSKLKVQMEEANISNFNDLIRRLLSVGWYVQVNDKTLDEIFYQLNKIGNNLNQIAKVANTNGEIYSNEIEDMQHKINEVYKFAEFYDNFIHNLQNGLIGKDTDGEADGLC